MRLWHIARPGSCLIILMMSSRGRVGRSVRTTNAEEDMLPEHLDGFTSQGKPVPGLRVLHLQRPFTRQRVLQMLPGQMSTVLVAQLSAT